MNNNYKIIVTLILGVFYLIGATIMYTQGLSIMSVIWLYNYVYFTYFLYRVWFEEKVIMRKLMKSNDFIVLKIEERNQHMTESRLKHKIKHWPFNEFEIITSQTEYVLQGPKKESVEVISLKTLNAPKHWFAKYFLGTGINFFYSSSSINDNKVDKRNRKKYIDKVFRYIKNHTRMDRQRKLAKIINLN